MLLDVFTLLNTRSNILPSGENVIVEKSSGHLNKKVKKRFASKYKKKIDNLENFFVVKELIINPFLTRNSEQSGIKEGDTLKLDIDPKSHSAWTGGTQKILDKGRVSKYNKKFVNLRDKKN